MVYRDVWSMGLGRWRGVHVRLHIFFVLFGVMTAYLAWLERESDPGLMWLALLSILILFLSVIVHECGHLLAVRRLGGHMDSLVPGPLGGLRPARVARDPQSDLLAMMAGPAATLGVVAICAMLIGISDPSSLAGMFRLLTPDILDGRSSNDIGFSEIVRLVGWINWWLLVVNSIPVFPFDGGRALASFLQVVFPRISHERAVASVATFARLMALALFVVAFMLRDALPNAIVPTWLALVLLSVFVFFSARVEETQLEADEEEELFGYDFSQGYTSLERSIEPPAQRPGPITRWLEKMKEQRRVRLDAQASAEEQEADEILRKLHQLGRDSLSPQEKALLKRVSARLRTRER